MIRPRALPVACLVVLATACGSDFRPREIAPTGEPAAPLGQVLDLEVSLPNLVIGTSPMRGADLEMRLDIEAGEEARHDARYSFGRARLAMGSADVEDLSDGRTTVTISDSVWTIVKGRFPWLLANLAAALLAAWVIRQFESSIQQMVALAVLMPIVASMGGNAGTQTMTVAVRALATRDLNDANAWRVVTRELMVGVFNGLGFAVIMGTIAVLWFQVADLGLVIGLAMVCVLAAAALGGIVIPITLIRLRIDPALASGPFVTTITDVVGFLSFLGIATLWFGLK